jgi:hypothetical protein
MTEGQKRNNAAREWWDSLTIRQKKKAMCLKQKKFYQLLELKFNDLPIDRRYEVIYRHAHFINI